MLYNGKKTVKIKNKQEARALARAEGWPFLDTVRQFVHGLLVRTEYSGSYSSSPGFYPDDDTVTIKGHEVKMTGGGDEVWWRETEEL